MSRMVSFAVLIGIIIVIGFLFYRVMSGFLLPLFLAALLVVIFRPLHQWIQGKCNNRARTAAGLTTACIMLIVLVPCGLVVTLAAIEGGYLVRDMDRTSIDAALNRARRRLRLDMPHAEPLKSLELAFRDTRNTLLSADTEEDQRMNQCQQLQHRTIQLASDIDGSNTTDRSYYPQIQHDMEELRDKVELLPETAEDATLFLAAVAETENSFKQFKSTLLGGPYVSQVVELANPTNEDMQEHGSRLLTTVQHWILSVTQATTTFLAKLALSSVVIIIAVYFFLLDGPKMVASVMRLSPLDDKYEVELLDEFDRVSRAVVVATLASAVTQGILAGFGYFLAGLDSVFLLILLTTLLALVPFVGAAAVWVPTCLWLILIEGHTFTGLTLGIYGVCIISMADNVIKPLVLHGQSKLHPLLALLSVLGGVTTLGPIGILIGPMVVVFLQTLLNILHRELLSFERQGEPGTS